MIGFQRFLYRIGLRRPSVSSPLLLLDIRETGSIRGFHVLAALHLAADRLRGISLGALTTGSGDELLALELFAHDHGLSPTVHSVADLATLHPRFVFTVMEDKAAIRANAALLRAARQAFVGLIFPADVAPLRTTIMDGHDTYAMARRIADAINPGESGSPLTPPPRTCAF